MDYLCSECSTQLTKFEIELNRKYPVVLSIVILVMTKKKEKS